MLSLRNPLSNMLTTWSSKRSSKARAGSTSSSASESYSSRASDGQQTPERKRHYRATTRSSYTVYAVSEREYDAAKLDLTKPVCLPSAPVTATFGPSSAGDRRGNASFSLVRARQVGETEVLPLELRPMDHSRPKCKAAESLSGVAEDQREEEEEESTGSPQPRRIVMGCLSTVVEEENEDEQAEEQRRGKGHER